jgi:hypothetical protein
VRVAIGPSPGNPASSKIRRLCWHAVGGGESLSRPIAFLDGTQQTERLANDGVSGLFWARIGAAVLERHDRRLRCALRRRRELLIGRQATRPAAPEFPAAERLPLPANVPPHPVRDQLLSQRIVDQNRAA